MQILEYDLVGKVEELRRLEKVLPSSLSPSLALSLSLSFSLPLPPAAGGSDLMTVAKVRDEAFHKMTLMKAEYTGRIKRREDRIAELEAELTQVY
jgi:hypothetical protein